MNGELCVKKILGEGTNVKKHILTSRIFRDFDKILSSFYIRVGASAPSLLYLGPPRMKMNRNEGGWRRDEGMGRLCRLFGWGGQDQRDCAVGGEGLVEVGSAGRMVLRSNWDILKGHYQNFFREK